MLSEQDVKERGVPWVLDKPYLLPRDPDGRCACMDGAGACTIYERRPGACRTYDCREDTRVWIDFAARIPAPSPAKE
jgi:Fe-S-cluster containining protein